MREKIIIAGFGGQGIMFTGKLLCQAGMKQGLKVTYLPAYGAEVRGGTAHCHVILSSNQIASPLITSADTLIVMNEPSLLKFETSLKTRGLLLCNSSLIKINPNRKDIQIESLPATDLAHELGDVKVTNMIMLGRYLACRNNLSQELIIQNLPGKGTVRDLNIKAIVGERVRVRRRLSN